MDPGKARAESVRRARAEAAAAASARAPAPTPARSASPAARKRSASPAARKDTPGAQRAAAVLAARRASLAPAPAPASVTADEEPEALVLPGDASAPAAAPLAAHKATPVKRRQSAAAPTPVSLARDDLAAGSAEAAAGAGAGGEKRAKLKSKSSGAKRVSARTRLRERFVRAVVLGLCLAVAAVVLGRLAEKFVLKAPLDFDVTGHAVCAGQGSAGAPCVWRPTCASLHPALDALRVLALLPAIVAQAGMAVLPALLGGGLAALGPGSGAAARFSGVMELAYAAGFALALLLE